MKHSIALVLAMALASPAFGQSIRFGDNSSEWARDGECDDRRFTGAGMASSLDADDIGHDAADCKRAFDFDQITVWNPVRAKAATQCRAIKFGDNSSEWARDGECDDYRFEGQGMASIVLSEDVGRDAKDCKALCAGGKIALRDY